MRPRAFVYNVQVSLDPTFAKKSMLAVNATVTGTRYAYSQGTATKYYWRVAAINGGFMSYYTAANNFTTAAGVNRATPLVGKSSVNASKYRLQIATDNAFTAVVADTLVLDTTAVLASPLLANTEYYRHVNAQNFCGAGAWSGNQLFTTGTVLAVEENVGLPTVFEMYQNYPKPFNPSTIICYDVPSNANVKIVIYDILGREVTTLMNGVHVAGRYDVTWNASGLATGEYIYRMEAHPENGAAAFTSVKKLLPVK